MCNYHTIYPEKCQGKQIHPKGAKNTPWAAWRGRGEKSALCTVRGALFGMFCHIPKGKYFLHLTKRHFVSRPYFRLFSVTILGVSTDRHPTGKQYLPAVFCLRGDPGAGGPRRRQSRFWHFAQIFARFFYTCTIFTKIAKTAVLPPCFTHFLKILDIFLLIPRECAAWQTHRIDIFPVDKRDKKHYNNPIPQIPKTQKDRIYYVLYRY